MTKQEKAVAIAKVLGWEFLPYFITKQGVRHEHYEESDTGLTKSVEEMTNWLAADAGTVAMILYLNAHHGITLYHPGAGRYWRVVRFSNLKDILAEEIIPNEALQKAILSLEEKEKS